MSDEQRDECVATVRCTHEVTIGGGLVEKRYRSWDRGEHRREWSVLRQLHRHRRGLAPAPVAADLTADPPTVTMTVVAGEPLGGTPSEPQLTALADALQSLWSTPHDGSGWESDLPFVRPGDRGEAAAAWWAGPDPVRLAQPPPHTVLGHGDPNLANYLWDGDRIRIVDFEDAGPRDPAAELARFAEHPATSRLDVDAFCARFDVDPERLAAYRRLWALFWLYRRER